ncbi:AMP-binding protein [Rhizobium leguminosarum]|uniref:AMP-binding protein n=1 Tax=Rhizobium leguminosarum TaxID=384 RepID=UPI000485DDB7|nr:AMP-binding protein [Rhizobium leguminosarum]WFT91052.1 AMP-binding protein [Rhizobium leguminosarum]
MASNAKPTLIPTLSGPRRSLRFGNHTVAEIISKTLDKYPDNIAIRTVGQGNITYRELGNAASKLVEHFTTLGVGPGDAVILNLSRSAELVKAILATQMLQVAFVPVDPLGPRERVDDIISSTSAKAVVYIDRGNSLRVDLISAASTRKETHSNIAYIMHTSGSTGVPKGIAISQDALLNMLDWYIDMFEFSASSSISQLTRPTFDPSIPEFFVPFATGGTIVLPETELRAQIINTLEFLAESGTNVIQTVPTLLRRLLGILERLPQIAERFTDLKYVLCGGEALQDSLRRRFYSVLPNATLINSYGPTECCVAVNYHYCQRDDAELQMFIGKPVPNVDFFVLDENQCEVGLGAEGELWLGGAQTPRQYLHDEAQSKLRFVSFPTAFGEQVLYRTGDYVVATEEQGLQFIGRKDDQTKYRGVRIEKGEISSAIDRTGLCADAAVVVVDGSDDGSQELICIVTPENVDADEVRARLSISLPYDRVPRLIVPLAGLPLTSSGKLNQLALEKIAKEALGAHVGYNAAQIDHPPKSPLDHLISSVRAVTGRSAFPSLSARECEIDSLKFLEMQLILAEAGLMFSEDVYQAQDVALQKWAERIQPIGHHKFKYSTPDQEPTAIFNEQLARVVEHIEARAPRMIVIHSSLIAVRNVDPKELVSALLKAIERISASTTVILPAFTWSYCSTRHFDWVETKSETGVLAELVRQKLSAGRTKHPVYSMVVTGPRRDDLCAQDWWNRSPFGDDSIFGELSRSDGLIVGIGTSRFTHVHRCELLANVPYCKTTDLWGAANFIDGRIEMSTSVYIRDVDGRPEYSFLAHDTTRDVHEMREVLQQFPVGDTYAQIVSASQMETCLLPVMRAEPYGFLFEEFRPEAQRVYPA